MIIQAQTNTGREVEMPRFKKKLCHSKYCCCSICKSDVEVEKHE